MDSKRTLVVKIVFQFLYISFFFWGRSICGLMPLNAQSNSGWPLDAPKISFLTNPDIQIITDLPHAQIPHSISNLWNDKVEFGIPWVRISPIGTHFTFPQIFDGLPVLSAGVKINVHATGIITSVINFTFVPPSNIPAHIGANAWGVSDGQWVPTHLDTLSQTLRINNLQTGTYWDYNLSRYQKQDTSVTFKVFYPDPLSVAQTIYGGNFQDFGDSDVNILNQQRRNVSLSLKEMTGGIWLENRHVRIRRLSPVVNYDTSLLYPISDITRGMKNFEAVNILYHISRVREGMATLGFGNLFDTAISIDPHGYSGDQSMFTFHNGKPVLKFGDGGVDDAEDADVIIHEYHHAVLEDASPGAYNGAEKIATDEGSCDYFAKTWNVRLDSFHAADVFPWDGHNPFFTGRTIISQKKYPADMTGSVHRNGEIWSSALWEIRHEIGRDAADKLAYQTQYAAAPFLTMRQMALLYLQADSLLFQSAHRWRICNVFSQKGLVPDCNVSIEKTVWKFPILTQIEWNQFICSDAWLLQNLEGRVLAKGSEQTKIDLSPFASGLYLIVTPQKCWKVLK